MPYDYVVFTGGNLPGGVTAGYDYQIMSCSNNTTFTLMDLYGNPITLSPPSSGSFAFTIYSQAPGATGAIGLHLGVNTQCRHDHPANRQHLCRSGTSRCSRGPSMRA